jgi:hypothetical protein
VRFCAVSSTAITTWQPGQANYEAMIARSQAAGGTKAVLFWQGESDVVAGTSEATYNSGLDAVANGVQSELSVLLMSCKLQDCTGVDETTINNAIGTAWGDNANVLTGPDLHGLATDDTYHLKSDANLASAAALWWSAIEAAFGW